MNARAERLPRGVTRIPLQDDREQAKRIRDEVEQQTRTTVAATELRRSWWDVKVKPMLDELAERQVQNSFGEEYTLSIQPKERS